MALVRCFRRTQGVSLSAARRIPISDFPQRRPTDLDFGKTPEEKTDEHIAVEPNSKILWLNGEKKTGHSFWEVTGAVSGKQYPGGYMAALPYGRCTSWGLFTGLYDFPIMWYRHRHSHYIHSFILSWTKIFAILGPLIVWYHYCQRELAAGPPWSRENPRPTRTIFAALTWTPP
mmetsp:Transcript_15017/g.36260  ORF Transcript_15017/g.36260 Transcript_15017/m.36260 type:complete len:174 (-) Transcript_15017:207-728(-)